MSSLFLSAHNDDEVLFGTFTLLRESPIVVICLRSYVQEAFGIDYHTRERETDEAMAVLGIGNWIQSPISDIAPQLQALEDFLWHMLDDGEFGDPDVVYAPAIESSGNEQHSLVGRAAQNVFGSKVKSYLTYSGRPGRRSVWGRQVPYEPNWALVKQEALACYRSQIEHFARNGSYHFADPDQREFYA